MITIDSFLMYVDDIDLSKAFYTEIFKCDAQVLSPTFIAFSLSENCTIELKQLAQVSPPATVTGGGSELSIEVESAEALTDLFECWRQKSVEFIQTPTELIFGLTFVAVDPDGHRIRVFSQR